MIILMNPLHQTKQELKGFSILPNSKRNSHQEWHSIVNGEVIMDAENPSFGFLFECMKITTIYPIVCFKCMNTCSKFLKSPLHPIYKVHTCCIIKDMGIQLHVQMIGHCQLIFFKI